MGVLEAGPAEFLRPKVQGKSTNRDIRRMLIKKDQTKSWYLRHAFVYT